MRHIFAGAAVGAGIALAAGGASARTVVKVTYEVEQPGVATADTSATLSNGNNVSVYATETFDELSAGSYNAPITFAPGGPIGASYSGPSGVQINPADQYGGAGGNGNYIVALPNQPYTLTISTPGVDYFGLWLSALDKGNNVTFYGESGQELFTFDPQDVINAISSQPANKQSAYYGNPFDGGADPQEPFVFLNFFDELGSFSKIVFTQTWSGGHYESDNQSLGTYETMGNGNEVPLVLSTVNDTAPGAPLGAAPGVGPGLSTSATDAPEPSTWAMLLLGFAGLAFAGCRGPRSIAGRMLPSAS